MWQNGSWQRSTREDTCDFGKYMYPTTITIGGGQHGDGQLHSWVSSADLGIEKRIGGNAPVTRNFFSNHIYG